MEEGVEALNLKKKKPGPRRLESGRSERREGSAPPNFLPQFY